MNQNRILYLWVSSCIIERAHSLVMSIEIFGRTYIRTYIKCALFKLYCACATMQYLKTEFEQKRGRIELVLYLSTSL